MVEIETEVKQYGNSYYFRVPKKLIDCQVIEMGTLYKLNVEKPK